MRRLLALALGTVVLAASAPVASSPAGAERGLVAVLPANVDHARLDAASKAILEETLRSVAGDRLTPLGFTVLTGETTLKLLQDNGIDPTGREVCEASCALEVARELKAELFLSASVQSVDGQHFAFVRLFESSTGKQLSSVQLEGATVRELRDDLRKKADEFFRRVVASVQGNQPVTAAPAQSLGGVPLPPALDSPGLGLEADVEVLEAYDAALGADPSGAEEPRAAAEAWKELAELHPESNPYRELAVQRAREWTEYADRLEAKQKKQAADEDRLTRILPLTSVPPEQKAQLVANFVTSYPQLAQATLAKLDGALQHAACARIPATGLGKARLEFEAVKDGTRQRARVLINDQAAGETPLTVEIALCRQVSVAVVDPATGARWERLLLMLKPERIQAELPGRCPVGMAFIPGGTFRMGDPQVYGARMVTLSPYCMDRTEVTVAQYRRCAAAGRCLPPPERVVYDSGHTTTCNSSEANREQHPVNCVDWNQADAYCRASGGRLPTEAEWEFAARGTDGRIFPWGNGAPAAQFCQEFPTCPVGSFPAGASPFGILDLAANVEEWVADYYDFAYPSVAERDPRGPPQGRDRVHRGHYSGTHVDAKFWFPANKRYHAAPATFAVTRGFRCVKSPSPAP